MLKVLFQNRLLIGAVVLFILCIGGMLLHNQPVQRESAREMAETQEPVKAYTEGLTPTPAEPPVTADPTRGEHIHTDGNPRHEASPEAVSNTLDPEEAFEPKDVVSVETPTEEVPVSPFGFGPYPDIPDGYPLMASWTQMGEHQEKFNESIWRELELMDRVLIKLFSEGDTSFTAGIVENGLVLPIYPNVAYVHLETEDWRPTWLSALLSVLLREGIRSRIVAGSHVSEADKEQIRKGKIPPGIEIRSFSEGIAPFTFLELPLTKD